jgi:dolichyl-phosphate-mannose-protein mannosyltransferase
VNDASRFDWFRLDPPRVALVLLLMVVLFFRVFWLDSPKGSLIFDEVYYVNASRVIAHVDVPEGGAYRGSPEGVDPNREHPPLWKVVIAGSIRAFGDNAFAWRLPSVLAGLAAILFLYLLVVAGSRDAWLGVIAAGAFAFDNLVFVHSRIATLDMPFVAVLLIAAWLWMRGWRPAAGVACGIAALIKLPAVYGFAALILLELGAFAAAGLRRRTWNFGALRNAGWILAGFAFTWIAGLWLLDVTFTAFSTPWEHVRYMLDYGFSISRKGGPANTESNPWQWLANEVQIPYIRVGEDVSANGTVVESRTVVEFLGAMNPVFIGAAPLAVAYSAWRAIRLRDRLSLWVVAWIAGTYLPYLPLVLVEHRTTYLYYMLAALPAIAVATAQLLRQAGLPRAVGIGYAVGLLIAFADYFPFRRVF